MGVTQPQINAYTAQAANAGFGAPQATANVPAATWQAGAGAMPGISGAVAPPVFSQPPLPAPMPMPASRVGPVNYASTVPVGNINNLPEIPPPHMVAPRVFDNRMAQPVPPVMYPPPPSGNFQNNFYNNNAYPPPYPMPPQQQAPAPPPIPQPPQQQTPVPPSQQQQPPAPPAGQTPNTPPVTQQVNSGGLDDQKVKDLNARLNSATSTIRSDAAMELFNILNGNPGLADNPQYKPYVDAFMEKILNDPSPLVRQPMLLAMETGVVKNPSSNTRQLLDTLSKGNGLYNIEPGIAGSILGTLGSAAATAGNTVAQGVQGAAGFAGNKLNLVSNKDNSISGGM